MSVIPTALPNITSSHWIDHWIGTWVSDWTLGGVMLCLAVLVFAAASELVNANRDSNWYQMLMWCLHFLFMGASGLLAAPVHEWWHDDQMKRYKYCYSASLILLGCSAACLTAVSGDIWLPGKGKYLQFKWVTLMLGAVAALVTGLLVAFVAKSLPMVLAIYAFQALLLAPAFLYRMIRWHQLANVYDGRSGSFRACMLGGVFGVCIIIGGALLQIISNHDCATEPTPNCLFPRKFNHDAIENTCRIVGECMLAAAAVALCQEPDPKNFEGV